jgi:phage-related protein
MAMNPPIGSEPVSVRFFRQESGAEPVRDWLKSLSPQDRKLIGEDIKTIQWGWPLGMPLVRPMGGGLYEVRTHLDSRIARVLFAFKDGQIILLHGFIKKSQETPGSDLNLPKERMKKL